MLIIATRKYEKEIYERLKGIGCDEDKIIRGSTLWYLSNLKMEKVAGKE